MNIFAIISSLITIIGCFLPWLQFGALFASRGTDSLDGGLIIVLSITTCVIALVNHSKKHTRNSWVFFVAGLIGFAVAFFDLAQAYERATTISDSLGQIGNLFGSNNNISYLNFIGSGLYIVGIGSFGLVISGFTGMLIVDNPQLPMHQNVQIKKEVEKNDTVGKTDLSLLNELKTEGILSLEEYNNKVHDIEFNTKLQEKIQPLIKVLLESKEKGLFSEEEFNQKKNTLIETQSSILRQWINNKPKLSDINPSILEELQEHHKVQLKDLLDRITEPEFLLKNVIVINNNKIKAVDKDRWKAIQEQGYQDKFKLIHEK